MKPNCYSFRSNRPRMVPKVRTERFKSSSFNWDQLDPNIKNSSSIKVFKLALLSFIRPEPVEVHNPKALKLLTRLQLGLSHLCEHKF